MSSRLILFLFGLFFVLSCKHTQPSMTTNSGYSRFIARQESLLLSNQYVIKYIDAGSTNQECILLVHGVPTSSWLYRNMIDMLVAKGYRVIAPDMLGYGQSDKPKGYHIYDPGNMGSYLLELMDSLQIDSWTHVCHDAGGLWTWEMLKQNAKKVSNLVLLNTIITQEGFNPPMEMKRNLISKLYVKSYTSNMSRKGTMKATIGNGLNNKKMCTPEMLEGYIGPTEGRLDRALYQFFSNVCVKKLPDYIPLMDTLNIHTKVIWGKNDKILVWEKQAEKVTKALKIKSEDILILENAKHFIQEEMPTEIVNFIAK